AVLAEPMAAARPGDWLDVTLEGQDGRLLESRIYVAPPPSPETDPLSQSQRAMGMALYLILNLIFPISLALIGFFAVIARPGLLAAWAVFGCCISLSQATVTSLEIAAFPRWLRFPALAFRGATVTLAPICAALFHLVFPSGARPSKKRLWALSIGAVPLI